MSKKKTKRDKKGKFAGSHPSPVSPAPMLDSPVRHSAEVPGAKPRPATGSAPTAAFPSVSVASMPIKAIDSEDHAFMGMSYRLVRQHGHIVEFQIWSDSQNGWMTFQIPVSARSDVAECRDAVTRWMSDAMIASRTPRGMLA